MSDEELCKIADEILTMSDDDAQVRLRELELRLTGEEWVTLLDILGNLTRDD